MPNRVSMAGASIEELRFSYKTPCMRHPPRFEGNCPFPCRCEDAPREEEAQLVQIDSPFGGQVHVRAFDGECVWSMITHGGHMGAWLVVDNKVDNGTVVSHWEFLHGLDAWAYYYSRMPKTLADEVQRVLHDPRGRSR